MVIANRAFVFIWPVRIRDFGDAGGAGCDLMPRASKLCVADGEMSIQDDRNNRPIKQLKINLGFISAVLDQFGEAGDHHPERAFLRYRFGLVEADRKLAGDVNQASDRR